MQREREREREGERERERGREGGREGGRRGRSGDLPSRHDTTSPLQSKGTGPKNKRQRHRSLKHAKFYVTSPWHMRVMFSFHDKNQILPRAESTAELLPK